MRVKEGNTQKKNDSESHSERPTICGLEKEPQGRDGVGEFGQRMARQEGEELKRRHMQNFGARVRILDFVSNAVGSH